MAIYGRDQERSLLQENLSACCNFRHEKGSSRANLVLIEGESGMGKTSLVEGCFRSNHDCFFAAGKCERLRRMVPLLALLDAIELLCDVVAAEPDHVVEHIKRSMSFLNTQSSIATRVPAVRKLFGLHPSQEEDSPAVSIVSGNTILHQFKVELRNLLSCVTAFKPVVLFLDDVQWCCDDTLEIIRYLVENGVQGLMLVVAVRSYDVSLQLPDNKLHMQLTGLDHEALTNLVLSELCDDSVCTDALVDLIQARTGGNPMFATQFMEKLMDEELVYYDPISHDWAWDLAKIREETMVSDNIANLLLRKILNLSPCAQQILTVASFFGSKFPMEMVKTVVIVLGGFSQEVFERSQEELIQECMVDQRRRFFKFSHDKVQQAAYEIIPESSRKSFHLRIGRILREHPCSGELWWSLVTTEQLNHGVDLISDRNEMISLAKLNLIAAHNASRKATFRVAANYCRIGMKLLSENLSETNDVGVAKSLATLLAEMEFCLGNHERSRVLIDDLLERMQSLDEKLPVYIIKMEVLSSEGLLDDAIQVGQCVLRQLGHCIPSKITKPRILMEVFKTKRLLRRKTDEDLLQLPQLTDSRLLFALRIMSLLGCYAYSADQPLFMLILSQWEMQIVLSQGVCMYAGDAFASYGVLMGHLGNATEAFRFSRVSLKLMDRFRSFEHDSQTLLVNHFFLQHLQKPLHDSIDPLCHSYKLGMAAGDIHNASLAFLSYICAYATCGLPLQPVVQDTKGFREELGLHSQNLVLSLTSIVYQSMLNLMGRCSNPLILSGEAMQEAEMLQYAEESGSTILCQMVYHQKATIAVYYGDLDRAGDIAKKLWNKTDGLTDSCTFLAGSTAFLYALTAINLCRRSKGYKRHRYHRIAGKYIKKLERWTKQGNPNVQHMLLILKAERLYLRCDPMAKVKEAYDKAINISLRSGFTHNAALVNERCSIFLADYGDEEWASDYLKRSHLLYAEWGAMGKAERMEDDNSSLESSRILMTRRRSTYVKGVSRFENVRPDRLSSSTNNTEVIDLLDSLHASDDQIMCTI